jgi:hypothetical protein
MLSFHQAISHCRQECGEGRRFKAAWFGLFDWVIIGICDTYFS